MPIRTERVIFFNNCANLPHVKRFGNDAFFDLCTFGKQAKQATGLPIGQRCIVATDPKDGNVIFTCYRFREECLMRNRLLLSDREKYRVFFGSRLWSEKLPKVEAASHEVYGIFFNRLGHFKRPSTIIGMVPPDRLGPPPPQDTARIRRLRKALHDELNGNPPKTPKSLKRVQRILKVFERPNPITRYVKRTRGSRCQLCSKLGFVKRDGGRYCEVHHLFHLSKNPPPDSLGADYLIVLCATCHRRMHYANVGDPVRTESGWSVTIDEKAKCFFV